MALAATGPFENLRPFVFGNHALELQQQLIFGRAGMRRLLKDRLESVTGKLFGQQDLIGIFSSLAVVLLNRYHLNVPLGSEIAQSLQSWPQKTGAAKAFVLDHPVIGYAVTLLACEVD